MVLLLASLTAGLFLSSSRAASISPPAQAEQIQWVNCTNNVPQPLQAQFNITNWGDDPSLPPLPSTLHCGYLKVPMDYSQPIGSNNTISVGIAMYRPDNPEGVIFYNSGGPGEPVAVMAWEVALNLTQTFNGLLNFDLMMMDVRGTFSSNELNCSVELFNEIPTTFFTNISEFDAVQTGVKNFAQSCIDLSSPPGIVQFIGTNEMVKDWEAIRIALGYDKISYYGISYGTFYGMEYLYRYPDNCDRFVLDAVFAHGMSDEDTVMYDMKAIDRLLLRADAYCMFNTTCPLHQQGKGSIPAAFQEIITQATQKPLSAPSCINSTVCNSVVTADNIRTAINFEFTSNPDFPYVDEALYQATQGDASMVGIIERGTTGPATDIASTIVFPLICLDIALDNNSYAGFEQLRSSSYKDDPAMLRVSNIFDIELYCSAWPFPAQPKQLLPTNHTSLMWVTADFDLNLPTEFATFAWAQAPNSVLVVRHGDDHGTLQVPNQPAAAMEVSFLATGVLPNVTDEELVTVYTPGSTRGPIPDPYSVPVGPLAGETSTYAGI
ncbi:hypothetical protein SERLA73DRAFT_162724 [Serpula lacrymans var. lacrymans S7.3]|uniref:AB hydrolase-1 domain-containing protein n=2 Tax=Serpula lacrymans var. lacrymans TaxID=341189 RepID=F8Q9D4_SERL3|nr:uncharacterized protein SERLADRAFT_417861 [Serpula lacrymans var. lacrymans S7.9]EGN95189.1 hypothetical protein SERLA73DRAFT_162724 [Serpula lacrymans var. lacrymans S7.3]EGO20718.1 hypothetical protein SERLADRAFT_417861 [Serpula lacrymans var. lacrymans S7.9]